MRACLQAPNLMILPAMQCFKFFRSTSMFIKCLNYFFLVDYIFSRNGIIPATLSFGNILCDSSKSLKKKQFAKYIWKWYFLHHSFGTVIGDELKPLALFKLGHRKKDIPHCQKKVKYWPIPILYWCPRRRATNVFSIRPCMPVGDQAGRER